ncbi:SseB family protein [Streptomyces sp. NPDC101151]|uniref:SseB family protein n=1 Tax=Streptomyces sp. NPDC101151 TaxID=3366115 RepID=UPI0037FFE90E
MDGVLLTNVRTEVVVSNGAGAVLAERIAECRGGVGDPREMVGELRRAALLVPLDGGRVWTGHLGGVRWIFAFTSEEALARFARTRGESRRAWDFAELLGARLLDEVVPAMEEPAGIAVDVADEDGAMLFPPVLGLVPESVAVDRASDTAAEVG